MATRKIGRDAKNGRFITVKEAKQRKSTATVETINPPTSPKKRKVNGRQGWRSIYFTDLGKKISFLFVRPDSGRINTRTK